MGRGGEKKEIKTEAGVRIRDIVINHSFSLWFYTEL